ncbi:hypothetical protein O4H66_25570 [Comamonadaceae bacterium G21597-S1]|nr:hypothetical protein [Comamonadaceae bacterium G21597-S1]
MIRCKLVETTHPDDTQIGARVGRAVSGETLGLGRAAACKIYLPDPRVRLEHAQIRRAEDGHLYLDATGPVTVDQKTQTSVRLAVGQLISVGPYDFIVEAVDDGADRPDPRLTLSFALRAQPVEPGLGTAAAVGITGGWIGRRSLAWVFSLLVIVLVGWPVWHAFQPPMRAGSAVALPAPAAMPSDWAGLQQQARQLVSSHGRQLDTWWNPGGLSSAHQGFAQDCRACHDKPFERVQDATCTTCHQNTGEHIRDVTIAQHTFQGQRCATCHKEHQGPAGMRTADAIGCVQCHGNVRAYSALTTLDNVSDFAKDHPPFRLSMRQRDTQPPKVLRISQTPELRNATGLVFPHDIHLAKAGIQSPTGPAASGGRVALVCANCHEPDAAGVRFAPVTMARHCQSCHRLSVDPQAPERQVPHARPAEVSVAVREIYASLAVDRYPVSLVTSNTLLQRPAGQAPASQLTSAGRWVAQSSRSALNAMFQPPHGVCTTCHAVQRDATRGVGAAAWRVDTIVYTEHWLPQSRFSHADHGNAACTTCHGAENSTSAGDILIPDIGSCRSCHAGAQADHEKVVSRCDSCHGFHPKKAHPVFQRTASAATPAPVPTAGRTP